MSIFAPGSLTRETYSEWIDTLQGIAVDSGVWELIDPPYGLIPDKLERPVPITYGAHSYFELAAERKKQYDHDIEHYRSEILLNAIRQRIVGEIRVKILDSLHHDHRQLFSGSMTCREIFIQIKGRFGPSESRIKENIAKKYTQIGALPAREQIDFWLMKWEYIDIMRKKMDMTDLNDLRLIRDFLSAISSTYPAWATNKRMSFLYEGTQLKTKFAEVLTEFRNLFVVLEY